MKATQEQIIKTHLDKGRSINPLQALQWFGVYRLSAVIFNLRKTMNIETTRVKSNNGNSYAVYKKIK